MGRKYKTQKKRGANDVIEKKEVPMGKRKNDGESNEKANQQKRSDVNSKEIAVAVDTQNQVNPSPILKLNAICCDDLFDWLSLKDLCSLGQTCKRMKQLTGVYYRENFDDVATFRKAEITRNSPYSDRSIVFAQFVRIVKFVFNSQKMEFQYVGMYCDSLREISFLGGKLDKSRIGYIKAKLDKIETIRLYSPDMPSSFNLYDDLLKFCPNLKNLIIRSDGYLPKYNKSLSHKFSKLEYFEFEYLGSSSLSRILEFFFQKNSHLRSFRTVPRFLLDNSDAFINPKTIKLDVLIVSFYNSCKLNDFMNVYMLLKKLDDNGQRFKFHVLYYGEKIAQDQINRIGSLRGLERLGVEFKKDLVFPKIISLKVIDIYTFRPLENIYLERMAASFPNLNRIHAEFSSEDQMLPFLRLLPKLKEIRIHGNKDYLYNKEGYNLRVLNEERKKLSGACKVTIYIYEWYYLKTKMALKNLYTNHDLIEIKRHELVERACPEL